MIDEYSDQNINTDDFTQLPSFVKRLNYCRAKLGRAVGSGSSRIVFKVDDNKVLKLAKNRKGLAQNRVECQNSHDLYARDMFPRVFEYDTENFMYIISEKARPAKEADFENIVGMSYAEFCGFCFGFAAQYSRVPFYQNYRLSEYDYEIVEENETLSAWYDYISNFQPYSIPEIVTIRNLGIVQRDGYDEIVIIDSGFDKDVAEQYYSPQKVNEVVNKVINEMINNKSLL